MTREFTEYYINTHCKICKRYSDVGVCFDHPNMIMEKATERCQGGIVDIDMMLGLAVY